MKSNRKKVLAICGSTRENSSNEAILKQIALLFGDDLTMDLYMDIGKLPHFVPGVENEKHAPTVIDFLKRIDQADGVIICTPEYVFSLPGALKNALEWTVSSTVFSNKPFAFIVASGLGEKAFESLDLIMTTILQYPISQDAKLLIQGARGKVNGHEQITDAKILGEIRRITGSLIAQMNSGLPQAQ